MWGVKADIFWLEGISPGRLGTMPRPRGDDWLDDEIHSLKDQGATVLVSLLTEEEAGFLGLSREAEVCSAFDVEFISFPIRDGGVPNSRVDVFDLVRKLADRLKLGEGVAIHCMGGIGRSSMIAACLLALTGESPADAFRRISDARGCSVPDTTEQVVWVEEFVRSLR